MRLPIQDNNLSRKCQPKFPLPNTHFCGSISKPFHQPETDRRHVGYLGHLYHPDFDHYYCCWELRLERIVERYVSHGSYYSQGVNSNSTFPVPTNPCGCLCPWDLWNYPGRTCLFSLRYCANHLSSSCWVEVPGALGPEWPFGSTTESKRCGLTPPGWGFRKPVGVGPYLDCQPVLRRPAEVSQLSANGDQFPSTVCHPIAESPQTPTYQARVHHVACFREKF